MKLSHTNFHRGRGGKTGQLCDVKLPKQREIVPKPKGKGRGRGRVLLDDDSFTEQPGPSKPFTATQLEQLKQEAGLSYNHNHGLINLENQFNINLKTANVYSAVN